MNDRSHLNAIQELFRLILAIRFLICPALAFDVLWAHTLRTGLEKATSLCHPFIHGHPLSHRSIHASLYGLQNTNLCEAELETQCSPSKRQDIV